MSCRLLLAVSGVLAAAGLFFLEKRAVSAWPPGGSFEQLDQLETPNGTVKLPILYFKGHVLGVFYLVDPVKAQELLPADLEPLVLPIINKAISGIFMLDYKNTTIGPYGEMGLTIQSRRRGSGATLMGYLWDMVAHIYKLPWMLDIFSSEKTGLYVVTLPVETENALLGGRMLGGFPKYLATFKCDWSSKEQADYILGGEFRIQITQHSSLFGIPLLPPVTMASLPFVTYTHGPHSPPKEGQPWPEKGNGQLLRTVVEMGSRAQYGYKDIQLDIFGTGQTADKMKNLGLEKLTPVAAFRTDSLLAHLPRGKVI